MLITTSPGTVSLPARVLRLLSPVLLLAGITACSGADAIDDSSVQAPAVEAVQAQTGALPLVETLSGVVRARNQVSIRPEISAPIVEVLVQTGETVVQGQPLVRLDQNALSEQRRQAEASLAISEASAAEASARVGEALAQVNRTRSLHTSELVSDVELETQEAGLEVAQAQANQAKARVNQAQATLAERRNASSRATIRAPVAGRVGQRNAEVGMLADPSSTLFLIGDFRELIVEVPLTEGMLSYVEEGQRVEVSSTSWQRSAQVQPQKLQAQLSRISPFLAQGSFSTQGEIDLGDAKGLLQPGMFVNVLIYYGETETATLVPNSAIWDDPASGVEGVWVVVDNMNATAGEATADVSPEEFKVSLQPVTVVARGRSVSGIQGVEAGTWVVTVGQQLLTEAQSARRPSQNPAEADPNGGSDSTAVMARVRPTAWERVVELQGLQREDLLRGFLEKQRRIAKKLGAAIPSTSQSVDDLPEARSGVPLTDLKIKDAMGSALSEGD